MTSAEHDFGEARRALDADFLLGGGQMGERIRLYNWADTPLGTLSKWPMPLRRAVSLCLKSQAPVSIYWGWPDLIVLYNDAFIRLAGDKHPAALGKPIFESWPELRPTIAPILHRLV